MLNIHGCIIVSMGDVFRKYHSETNPKDIVITLGNTGYQGKLLTYDVTNFLEMIQNKSDQTISNINDFTYILDKNIHIDKYHPQYRIIYKELEIILNRLSNELSNTDPSYEDAILRSTGSIYGNVKVGLPHEADFVLVLVRPEVMNKVTVRQLFELVHGIVHSKKEMLTSGLGRWIIHEIKFHRTVGISLVMQYTPDSAGNNTVGVSVDLVPVYQVGSGDDPAIDMKLTSKATEYLPYPFEEYLMKGDIYQLIEWPACDTAVIENEIINQLPDNKKRGFRIAKYLVQHIFGFRAHKCKSQDQNTCIKLYGYKSRIRSYHLKLCFLQLMLHTEGTAAASQLTDGVLALCLHS